MLRVFVAMLAIGLFSSEAFCAEAIRNGNAQQEDQFRAIVFQCAKEIKEGKSYGAGDPMQSCLIEKRLTAIAVPETELPSVPAKKMGTTGQGAALLKNAVQPEPADNPAPSEESKSATSGDTGAAPPVTTPQAGKEEPSDAQKYYIQSGKSGSGAKPIFLNR